MDSQAEDTGKPDCPVRRPPGLSTDAGLARGPSRWWQRDDAQAGGLAIRAAAQTGLVVAPLRAPLRRAPQTGPNSRNVTPMSSQLWRAVAVYRIVTLAYAAVWILRDETYFTHPLGGFLALAVMAVWTIVTVAAYSRPAGRKAWLIAADVVVATILIISTRWIDTAYRINHGAPTIPVIWVASAILACAVAGGPWVGMAGAVVVWFGDVIERQQFLTESLIAGLVLLLVAGGVGGYVVRLTLRAEAAVDQAARREAAIAERERIARGIHDSVLQVLALVSSRGREIGGEAAELGVLAAEQESALRSLVSRDSAEPDAETGMVDVRSLVEPLSDGRVTISCPATPVMLPKAAARALSGAASAAVDNIRRHAGETARGWVLVENDGSGVRISIRDDGRGFAPGRLTAAASTGRLGVSHSIVGRIREVGGTATVTSRPGQGTEVELHVPQP
jgi:signal transduction histidine kinase